MNIVCYGNPMDKTFHDLWSLMRQTHPELGLELHSSLLSFSARLREPRRNIAVVMLYINDRETMTELLSVRSLLKDLPIVILLKDQEPGILEFAHQLMPRVIVYTWWRIGDICGVLQRCIGRSRDLEVILREGTDTEAGIRE